MSITDDLIERLARVPNLLVASDYDGTISEIVPNPRDARPTREAIVALHGLAELPRTHVAIISGRSLRELQELTGISGSVHLVGSHGGEFDADFAQNIDPETTERLRSIIERLDQIAASAPGFLVERKPASAAFHYRNADEDAAQSALRQVLEIAVADPNIDIKRGKMVLELCVIATDKGKALQRLRRRVAASATVFVGDDITDEDAFLTLAGPDLAIKVGQGTTTAPHRVADPNEVARFLARLFTARQAWINGADAFPIEQHSLLSDHRTIALVTPDASINWMCLPRMDSAGVFADLLGGSAAGGFSIRPADDSPPIGQRYRDKTMTVETSYNGFTVTDWLYCDDERSTQPAGRSDLLRRISGTGRVRIEFAPRLDFGRMPTRMHTVDDALVVESPLDPIYLHASAPLRWMIYADGDHHTAIAECDLPEGGLTLELRFGERHVGPSKTPYDARLNTTESFWSDWTDSLRLPTIAPEIVQRSALTLRSLIYGPTGAVAAAATTSLPEHIGGVRNWDYRYCWIRDGAMSVHALVRLGKVDEALSFLGWLRRITDAHLSCTRLHPLYTVLGHELGSEAEIGELAGYCGSRPVRVGNGASSQIQLDVFGPVADLIHRVAEATGRLDDENWQLIRMMVEAVADLWHEPDNGIWEIRGPKRHHVHSKCMCWMTLDRAIKVGAITEHEIEDRWVTLAAQIKEEILENGFSTELNTFTDAYGSKTTDASCLLVGLSGLLDPQDPRFAGTVSAIEEQLRDGPTVYRYHIDDGLPGSEGGFFLCASWLVDAYLLIGRTEDAKSLFDDLVDLAGPTGLIPEQYDPKEGRTLGNHPQAYSHLGLIENAWNLQDAGVS